MAVEGRVPVVVHAVQRMVGEHRVHVLLEEIQPSGTEAHQRAELVVGAVIVPDDPAVVRLPGPRFALSRIGRHRGMELFVGKVGGRADAVLVAGPDHPVEFGHVLRAEGRVRAVPPELAVPEGVPVVVEMGRADAAAAPLADLLVGGPVALEAGVQKGLVGAAGQDRETQIVIEVERAFYLE